MTCSVKAYRPNRAGISTFAGVGVSAITAPCGAPAAAARAVAMYERTGTLLVATSKARNDHKDPARNRHSTVAVAARRIRTGGRPRYACSSPATGQNARPRHTARTGPESAR